MLNKYIIKGSFYQRFDFRGEMNRLGKEMKKNVLELRKKQKLAKLDKSWVEEYNKHLGKPVEVKTFYFDTTDGMKSKTSTFFAILDEIDTTSEYCKVTYAKGYSITVHKSNITL